MADIGSSSVPAADGKIARRIGLALAGLVLAGCCFWSGLGAWLLAPLTPYWANHLDRVQGQAELLAPAQWQPGVGQLSPDGRWMVLGWIKDGVEELFIWDLVMGERKPFNLHMDSMRWINADYFAVVYDPNYYLVNARDATITPITLFPKEQYRQPDGLDRVQARWKSATQIYTLHTFSIAGYTILTHEQGQFYVYREFNLPDDQVKALLEGLTHVEVPIYGWHPPTRTSGAHREWLSPDGRLYATRDGANGDVYVRIYSHDGRLLAEAYKGGWSPRVLGWAHDSSGVYVQWEISGSSAAVVVPYKPLFKLSPLTPEEQRSRLIWRIATWAGGIGVVGGAGWWLWRRRRRVAR